MVCLPTRKGRLVAQDSVQVVDTVWLFRRQVGSKGHEKMAPQEAFSNAVNKSLHEV